VSLDKPKPKQRITIMKYVTWNQFSAASIKQAEQRKQKLEIEGWCLVHSTAGCLTYQKKG
jgi:hypothetical protein